MMRLLSSIVFVRLYVGLFVSFLVLRENAGNFCYLADNAVSCQGTELAVMAVVDFLQVHAYNSWQGVYVVCE